MHGSLTGQRAFVTGGSRGIGLAIARTLTAEGARGGVRPGSRRPGPVGLRTVQADVTVPDQLGRAVDAAADQLGGLDLLVANVGGSTGGRLLASSPADWESTFALNVLHAVFARSPSGPPEGAAFPRRSSLAP